MANLSYLLILSNVWMFLSEVIWWLEANNTYREVNNQAQMGWYQVSTECQFTTSNQCSLSLVWYGHLTETTYSVSWCNHFWWGGKVSFKQNFNLGQCHSLFSIIFPLLTLKLITFYFLSAAKEDPIKPVAKPSTAEANKEKSKVKPEEPKSKPVSDTDVVVCSSEFHLL